ncbi:UDP-N-acetylglucosamine 1-carboxyvinyltransferase [Candidatus Auribacterota bacterium]
MDKIVVTGGGRLRGTVDISGSKNAALPIIAATILADSPSLIKNVPALSDVQTMAQILEFLGAKVSYPAKGQILIDPRSIIHFVAPYELVRKMRASICVLGPLLGRFKKAKISMPGGCVIGTRPIDIHLKGMQGLNARVNVEHGYVVVKTQELRGSDIFLGGRFGSSVLATANVMMAAVKAKGVTIIESAACEPELVDLADFLNKMGAKIEGAGSHVIKIQGVRKLKGAEHTVIPDRIEVGTYMIAAAMTKGDVRIKDVRADHLHAVIDKLKEAGVSVIKKGRDLRVSSNGKLKVVDVITLPYPGFPTDLQAQMMALMTITKGISVITEKIYPDRFMHVPELTRMAADISLEGSSAIVKGVDLLSGAPVMASDLRASAALVLAGLVSQGETEINRVYHIDRGYEFIEKKLGKLGARIKRVEE